MSQQQLELPKGWTKSQFDKCISYIIGGDWGEPFKDKVQDNFVKVRVLRSTELKNWKKERGSTAETRIIKKSSLDKRQLHDGNIILEISGGGTKFPVGRSVLIDNSILKNFDVPIICSNFFRKITLEEFLDPVYASNFLDYNYSTGLTIKFKKQSVNIQNLNTSGYLSSLLLPIPPLNEQKRIVSKIEELFSKIDSTKQSLERTKLQLVQYRHSLLKSAFEGKLTEKWREQNKDRIEPVAKLLTKILNEQNSGSEENLNIEQELPNLPESWIWSSIKTICKNHDHQRIPINAKKRKQIQGKIPYYGASGIIDYVEKPIFSGKYFLIGEDGANLISRSTPVGFIVEGDFWVNNHAHILSTYGNIPLEFLSYYIASISLRPWISGTAQPKLNQENLKKIPVPLPPMEEQEQIVSQIEQSFSLVENSQRIVNSTLQTLETMRISVLKQAFQGKLVPQDPNDEPAEILLEQIKKERDTLASKNRLKRSGRFRS